MILFALALLLMLGIVPWIDPLLASGLMLLGCGLIGIAMILALRVV